MVPGSIPGQAIDHEIFSMVIFPLPLIQEGQLPVTGKSMGTEYWLTTKSRNRVVTLTDHPDMTIAVSHGHKTTT